MSQRRYTFRMVVDMQDFGLPKHVDAHYGQGDVHVIFGEPNLAADQAYQLIYNLGEAGFLGEWACDVLVGDIQEWEQEHDDSLQNLD